MIYFVPYQHIYDMYSWKSPEKKQTKSEKVLVPGTRYLVFIYVQNSVALGAAFLSGKHVTGNGNTKVTGVAGA